MTDIEPEYQQALDYLYSFVDYSLTRNLRYSPEKFDLTRMVALVERLGNPQNQYPIIHVAGTKGKGSTAALCASALKAAGYRVGFYTSPHLSDYTERIQVNGQPVSHTDLVHLVGELKPHVAAIERLTTFELTTALAFQYFQLQKVDIAVVEVGLGGRLDATNIITPLLSVITSLSHDHMAVLGDTLAEIAGEKAGIIKDGKPVILSPQPEEARLVVEKTAIARSAPIIEVGKDFLYALLNHTQKKQTFLVWQEVDQNLADNFLKKNRRKSRKLLRLTIPLLGQHQVENAAAACAALITARTLGVRISDHEIAQGFAQVYWPGRFEFLRLHPPLVIDSAHNRDSALRLRQTLDDYLPGRPIILLFGASEDKDIVGMLAELLPRTQRLVVTQSEHPRAMAVEQLAALASQFGSEVEVILPLEKAFDRALELANQNNAIVVSGSIFIAAAVREIWKRRITYESR